MSAKRRRSRNQKGREPSGGGSRPPKRGGIRVRRVPDEDAWEFVFPRCVVQRRDDIQEVHAMLSANELDIAADELRWLLEDCRELLEAHGLLGRISLAQGDLPLARAHFGYAYDMGRKALPKEALAAPLSYSREANRPFFDAGKGLAHCLSEMGQRRLAADVVEELLRLDPSDPLALRDMFRDEPGE